MQRAAKVTPPSSQTLQKRSQVQRGYWKSIDNQRQFFEKLAKEIGVKKLDDWYSLLNVKTVESHGGRSILFHYQRSAIKALLACYPEHNWVLWKFKRARCGLWSGQQLFKYITELSQQLGITTLEDWYRVDRAQLCQHRGASLLRMHGSLFRVLQQTYPDYHWDRKKFKISGRKVQRWLAITLNKMFPNTEILEDYQHPQAVFPSSKRPIQLDIFIPSLNLAFEYQGEHHFRDLHVFQPSHVYKHRDEEKRLLCQKYNITLVEVPYWWNRTAKSLHEMILECKQKPPDSQPVINT